MSEIYRITPERVSISSNDEKTKLRPSRKFGRLVKSISDLLGKLEEDKIKAEQSGEDFNRTEYAFVKGQLNLTLNEYALLMRAYREVLKPPSDLNEAMSDQVNNYVDKGFHHFLNMKQEVYINSFPVFKSQPKGYSLLELNLPVLVDPRIDIIHYIHAGNFLFAENRRIRSYSEPKDPYYAWFQYGKYTNAGPAMEINRNLGSPEVGVTLREALAFCMMYGWILDEGNIIEVTGTTSIGNAFSISKPGNVVTIASTEGKANPLSCVLTKGELLTIKPRGTF